MGCIDCCPSLFQLLFKDYYLFLFSYHQKDNHSLVFTYHLAFIFVLHYWTSQRYIFPLPMLLGEWKGTGEYFWGGWSEER